MPCPDHAFISPSQWTILPRPGPSRWRARPCRGSLRQLLGHWDFYGHQVVTHETAPGSIRTGPVSGPVAYSTVDGKQVPVPHFGLALSVENFHDVARKLKASRAKFVIEPYLRFQGEPGEQWTMFTLDPAGNALEFKAFADESQIFAK